MYKNNSWFYSTSRVNGYFKKIAGFEDWFYTGPTKNFGHNPPGGNKRN
jgi:hypothetical protein